MQGAAIAGNSDQTVATVDDGDLAGTGRLVAALERAGFWRMLTAECAGHPTGELRIVIKPELAGFAAGSPSVTDPALVEALVDILHDGGCSNVCIAGTADSSALWADNRDLYALSDLLGYRFTTDGGRPYDIVDLADPADQVTFPAGNTLHGGTISRTWIGADIRIVFSKNRTDETAGYALCLDTLIGVLPLTDKDVHYRTRRDPGDVVTALLAAAPVHFCLIDAMVSAHGVGGRRAPEPIKTATIIAASDIVLADYVGALKMGLDPVVSPIFAKVVRVHPLPQRYTVSGTLGLYRGWSNVPAPLLRVAQARNAGGGIWRLVEPWLQCLDPDLFPLKHPLDARLNAVLAGFFADAGRSEATSWLLTLANLALGLIDQSVGTYRTLFDKDALHHQAVPLGIDTAALSDTMFDDLVDELLGLERIAAQAPIMCDNLRWRYVGEAVLFCYTRSLPIEYDLFVRSVDIARTIQFMNDYIGGVLMPLSHDEAGRPVRQAERNIYLPQPNYLALFQGKPIDVSKLEVVEYGTDRNRLYWKTIKSENSSATFDDGIATFERASGGTRVTIMGRQQFALPLFWQVFDPSVFPDLKTALVTHAYRTFFDGTIANFEALVEGREIRIGRPVDEPAPRPVERLMTCLEALGEIIMPLLERTARAPAPNAGWVDHDGFVHMNPAAVPPPLDTTDPGADRWIAEITQFLDGLRQAAARDMTWAARPQ